MIKIASEIIEKNLMNVDVLDGVRRIQNIFKDKDTECFAAFDNKNLVGVVTKKELVGAHPNRIVADIMSDKYLCVDRNTYIWEVRETFDSNTNINIIFVKNEDKIIGYLTRTILNIELGKHIDLLTGLYKNDYMFYNAYNLIRSGEYTTIIFIDLDNFGKIDKKYGHINGDKILIDVADLLNKNVSSGSYLCRYAGDEFAIVTPYNINESRILAEKITSSINSFPFPNNIPVSASIGITGIEVQNRKIENISGLINKLVNLASLSSTKAKQSVNNSIIIEDVNLDAIA